MNAKCEFIDCNREATFALGDSYFCKSHQESLNLKLSKMVETNIENSHHVNLDTLRRLMRDPEIKKLIKVSLNKKEIEEN